MKKFVFCLLLIGGLGYAGYQFSLYYGSLEKKEGASGPNAAAQAPATASPRGAELPGLVPALEPSLEAAYKLGAPGLKKWLGLYRTRVQDPRLAAIELDYVVLVTRVDLAEARTVYFQVKERTPPGSPLHGRVQQLQKAYE